MMNPIIQSLFDRKSCRIFKDKQISQEERKLILSGQKIFLMFCLQLFMKAKARVRLNLD